MIHKWWERYIILSIEGPSSFHGMCFFTEASGDPQLFNPTLNYYLIALLE